jgi:tetratricopeptide (TPR) repeat protein
VPLRLNAEKEGKSVAAKYKVTGFPTILFVNGSGKVVHSIVGYLPPADFAAQMELANLARDLPLLERRASQHPTDAKTLSSLVAIYSSQKEEAKMTAALGKFRAADRGNTSGYAAKTLNAVGDYYQLSNKMQQALPYFEEAAKVAKNPRDVAYALISEASCYMGLGDKKSAIPILERFLRLGPAAKDYEATAKSMLENAKKD